MIIKNKSNNEIINFFIPNKDKIKTQTNIPLNIINSIWDLLFTTSELEQKLATHKYEILLKHYPLVKN